MKTYRAAAGLVAMIGLAGACTTAELEAISAGLAAGLAEASYEAQAIQYGGPYYAPSGFASYHGWPGAYAYGDYVGVYGCSRTGAFYTCDSNGDGYADMYGNTDDGSYASSSLRVNGRGEAFTWDSDCSCWVRNRAFDGPRDDYHDHYRDW